MTLTEFLLARIAEDEEVARYAIGRTRALAECEAKRRIVARVLMSQMVPVQISDHAAEAILRALALPYADHPDYQPEWTP